MSSSSSSKSVLAERVGTTTVTVAQGWAVYDGTEQRHAGATLDVDRETAQQWLASGWVTETPAKTTRTPARSAQ